jgi:hypothetical protein
MIKKVNKKPKASVDDQEGINKQLDNLKAHDENKTKNFQFRQFERDF